MDSVHQVINVSWRMANDTYTGITEYVLTKGIGPMMRPVAPPPQTVPASSAMASRLVNVASLFGKTSPWIRVAGLSGALAVSMGAYGAHGEFIAW